LIAAPDLNPAIAVAIGDGLRNRPFKNSILLTWFYLAGMEMKTVNLLATAFIVALSFTLFVGGVSAQVLITEVSSDNRFEDWFELTNTGDAAVNLNGYYWDDNGPTGADGALFGDVSIAPGESIVVIRGSEEIDLVATEFREIYGLDSSVQVITEDSVTGPDLFSGLSSNGDEVALWDGDPNPSAGAGVNLIDIAEFPAAPDEIEDPDNFGRSFDFSSGDPVLSVVGENGAVLGSNGDVGSPGFAAVDFTDPAPGLAGDFEPDGDVDADDIDFYSGNIGEAAVGDLVQLDFDNDDFVTLADHQFHIENFVLTSNGQVGTNVGDINLDGTVNVLGDALALVGGLGLTTGAGYADGDLNADGAVNVLGDALVLVSNLGLSNEE